MMNVFALISIKKKTKLKYYLSRLLKGFFFFFWHLLKFCARGKCPIGFTLVLSQASNVRWEAQDFPPAAKSILMCHQTRQESGPPAQLSGPAVETYAALRAIQSWWHVRLCGHWLKQATWTRRAALDTGASAS